MTLTEAVNQMLEVIGELVPVDDALTSDLLEAQRALVRLNEVSKTVQEKGWTFNTEVYPTWTPPVVDGKMTVGSDILKIDSDGLDIVQRGTLLFNRATNSSSPVGALTDVSLVRLLPFDQLPPVAQTYITIRASRQFQKRWLGSSEIDAFTKDDENAALVAMTQSESENDDVNFIYGSQGQYWTSRGGF